MFLSELKVGDAYALDDVNSTSGQTFKVERIEEKTFVHGTETWYGVVDMFSDERFRINNPYEIKVLKSDEIRPKNISTKIFIKVKPTPPDVVHGIDFNFPVGHITYPMVNVEKMEGYLLPEGQALKKEEYPELYAAIGDSYTQTREVKEFPLNGIEKVKKLFKIKFTARTYFVETRNCGEDEFRIPDLRGQFITT